MKNIFNSNSNIFFIKISLLTNIRNKGAIRKTSWKMVLFFLQKFVIFSEEMGNIRACKEVSLQKLTNLRLSG